jgi:hypothetical protein
MTRSRGPKTEVFSRANKGSRVKRTRLKIRSTALIAIMAFSAFVFLLAGPPVQAQLSKVGPIDPNTGMRTRKEYGCRPVLSRAGFA